VTICTKNRRHYFSEIGDGIVTFTPIGNQAIAYWQEIPQHFPKVELGEFVVMPNHIHGIIGIVFDAGSRHGVTPQYVAPQDNTPQINEFGKTIPGSLSAIIGQFKSTLTRWNNKNSNSHFAWQSKFHDHIIRNQDEFDRIENYIVNNIKNWKDDGFFK
jgi:REP element-mobilizing transposase RayT